MIVFSLIRATKHFVTDFSHKSIIKKSVKEIHFHSSGFFTNDVNSDCDGFSIWKCKRGCKLTLASVEEHV